MTSKDALINDFASRSFRDLADQDYIAARMAYRLHLDQQFLWCALQAVEKYLKAILIYNRVSAKGLGHDLGKALIRVKGVKDLGFGLPADVERFVKYVSDYGADRYLSYPTHLQQEAFLMLDKTVWNIRRYCFFMRQVVNVRGAKKDLFEVNRQRATSSHFANHPHKYRLFGGYLEKIIKKKGASYEALVWKNFYFGRRRKRKIRNFTFRMTGTNPTHSLHPEIFGTLDGLVDFPQAIRPLYKANS